MTKLLAKNDKYIEEFLSLRDGDNIDVRSDGTIWTTYRCPEPRLLGGKNKSGYLCIRYKKGKVKKDLLIHRIIYRKFIGPLDELLTINHIDGDPTNNHPSNLELVSTSLNNINKFIRNNTPVYGNRNLTQEEADEVRKLYFIDKLSYTSIMKKFPNKLKSKGHVSDIINNNIYAGKTSLADKIKKEERKILIATKKIEYFKKIIEGQV